MKGSKLWSDKWMQHVDSVPLQPILELCADRRVLIENHRGVSVYEPESIHIRVSFGELAIDGDRLQICRMQNHQLVIRGRIDSIRVLRR